ncbi:BRCT domain-containing protein [Oxalobacteraceae bacterium R-40]|uniref:BRCT domain-containing protein n=1 Tax=Keguizhuia sedimenti TaxID=3064264 RepID=A0ABU1BJ66_9BURK|nr:BRCT domain-containing protein [Oxalobacteraceae bacterium R-40]
MPWLKDIRSRFFKSSLPKTEGVYLPPLPRRPAGIEGNVHRQINELIGLLKGVTADGSVQQSEVEFLLTWLESNKKSLDQWPAKAIYPRLKSALSDGNLDDAEEEEIHALLEATISEHSETTQANSMIEIPFTEPIPDIQFANRSFCFTGRFQSGSRSWCVSQIIARGGMSTSKIDRKLHYLVVGDIGGTDWFRAKHGRKIVRAIKHIEVGANIAILREQHWFEQLKRENM